MIFVSDVHDSPQALERVAGLGESLVILGDLVNLTDYRSGAGAVAQVMGAAFAMSNARARARGDYAGMRDLWRVEAAKSGLADLRTAIGEELSSQYQAAAHALRFGSGYVIHGNVDRPSILADSLPDSFRYVHGEVVEIDGVSLGLIGGGVATPIGAEGEVSDDEMSLLLGGMEGVDVLGTHVAPAVPVLRRDVITGRQERGSEVVRAFIEEHQPRFHIYGDVHQPAAATWRLRNTRCINAGYFRATGRFVRMRDGVVQVGVSG